MILAGGDLMGIMEVTPSHDKKLHNNIQSNFSGTDCADLSLFPTRSSEVSCFAVSLATK